MCLKKRIKDYPVDTSGGKTIKLTDRGKNKVELSIFKPEGYNDTWMDVQSEARQIFEATNCEHTQLAVKKYIVYD